MFFYSHSATLDFPTTPTPAFNESVFTRAQDNKYRSSQIADGLWEFLPDVDPAGISLLAALAEVSHPAVVSKTTDCDNMKALAALGTLVDFVMFGEGRAGSATLIGDKKGQRRANRKMRWR